MDFTCRALNTPISQVYFHTDSTIVLAWIRSHASRWKTFVANRVAKIQTLSSPVQWHHVSGNANPADLATRGVSSSALVTSLWLRGPDLLYNLFPFQQALSAPLLNDSVPEQRCALQSTTAASHLTDAHDLFYKYSSLTKLKRVVALCLRASVTNQLMSDLPSSRVSPAPAFLRCGVDYAGPFQIKANKGRGSRSFKAYIALFVCFTTRAIHLELVTDLSADVFIAALERFISRRGKSSDIYSDCGSNFVGAKRKLMEFERLARSATYNQNVSRYLVDNGIKWHLNVPRAPHMGGLWEASIKSTKYRLKRVVALTPGHFLIGRSLTSIPEPNCIEVSHLTRWQHIQKMVQQFWKRWHKEYLCRLQQRPKWLLPTKNLQVNDLCLIKEDNLPPTKWKMGRITQLHPGFDNIVRIVTIIKTSDGMVKRNITKLCSLPI
ncbi:uncharacterized protein LOC118187854 [Stegodyphus dumicola]|uniref:uncharacterized protein LOC118187854 n=1 Tax=Stegodyphus dumicola TaxID=202533 RepID=UPI0015A784F7|nr:uncharacterized protein LOC118187854 [Stegodyphus dumicola]